MGAEAEAPERLVSNQRLPKPGSIAVGEDPPVRALVRQLWRLAVELVDYAEVWGHVDAASDYRGELGRFEQEFRRSRKRRRSA